MRRPFGLLPVALALAGCFDFAALLAPRQRGDLGGLLDGPDAALDAGASPDLQTLVPIDGAVVDQGAADGAPEDLSVKGGVDATAGSDLSPTLDGGVALDLAVPALDLATVDLALPDLVALPDLARLDAQPPDLTPNPNAQFYKLQAAPVDVRPADLDGDGWPDLVVSCSTARTVVVLHNDGTGHFAPLGGQPLIVGAQTGYFAEPRDYDGDGKIDVVVTLPLAAGVILASGRGDGTLGATTTFNLPSSPTSIAAADFNGDKLVDVAVAVVGNTTGVTLLLAQAKGLGQPGRVVSAGVGMPAPMVTADLDRNGTADLVVGSTTLGATGIVVLPGKGDGTFLAAVNLGSAPIQGIAVADLDVDGQLDLVTGDPPQGGFAALRGLGGFKFAAPVRTAAPGSGVSHVAVADLTRSAKPDVVLVESSSDDVTVFQGKGTLQPRPRASYPTGAGPAVVRVSDFDRDGHLDLVTADYAGAGVTVVLFP